MILEEFSALCNRHMVACSTIKAEMGEPHLRVALCLILCSVQERPRRIGDLLYFGTNASYNLRLLDRGGYVTVEQNNGDTRSKLVAITPKGAIEAKRFRLALERVKT